MSNNEYTSTTIEMSSASREPDHNIPKFTNNIIDFNFAKRQDELERSTVDADDIRERLHADARGFVQWLFSGRAHIHRNEARVGDVYGTPGASLSIKLSGKDAGLWKDHATSEGGDLIALYRACMGYQGTTDFVSSLKEIAKDYLGDPVEVEHSAWRPTATEKIEQAKEKLGTKPRADLIELGAPVATYKYFDTRGNIIASVVRYEPDGTRESKTFRPYCFRTFDGIQKWTQGAPDLRPLYRLPEITLTSTVVLVEGEGCAEALASLGIEATSAMQGANAPIDKTDWSPLAGKTVVIWPDKDAPGEAYGRNVAARLQALGCTVLGITPPEDASEGWDAVDAIAEGRSPQEIIAGAAPVRAAAEPNEPVDPVDLWGKFSPPTLPRGLLPEIIEHFAFDQGRDMGADISGVAMAALVICAAAIPDKVQLQVKRHNTEWRESARLWVALIGPPSSKKSPILTTAARPLRKIDARQARDYAQLRAAYDRLPKEEKAETEPPKQVRSVVQDVTIEAVQDVAKDNPNGLLCYQDELSGWFGSMDKYSGGRGSARDRAFWLEAFNGGTYSVQRVARGSVFIENLSVSLIGGIQPEPIREIADESVDDGLLQRLLPITLAPAVTGRDEAMSQVVVEYDGLISRLRGLATATLRFDEEAQRYREELEVRHNKLQRLECIHRKLANHIGKYDGIFARLCVVWHCIENVEAGSASTVISEQTARRVGSFLHGFLLPHAYAFYNGVLGLSNDHDNVMAVAGYILSHGLTKITNRDLKRGDRTMRRLGPEQALAVFEQLEAFGWLDRVSSERRAPSHWRVNPAVHQKFAERAKSETERRAEVRQTIKDAVGAGVEP
jgi:hypothetical protein